MSITTKTRLGRYEIRSQLGAGGRGEVYLAEDTKLRRKGQAFAWLDRDVRARRRRAVHKLAETYVTEPIIELRVQVQ